MRKAAAFCPSYITGIFTIEKNDAAGAGFSIDRGMITSVKESRQSKITINGKKSKAPVSQAVIGKYAKLCGKTGPLSVSHEAQLPIGFGCGMSAAGAVSLSLALNELLGAGLSFWECIRIAHDAEVECKTGLSGADAAAIGGMIARKSVQDPPLRLPFPQRKIYLAFHSAIKTGSIIADERWKIRVNAAGKAALEAFFAKPDWHSFIACSRRFALECDLAKWCEGHLAKNRNASMAMVGKTLFSSTPLHLGRGFKRIEAKTTNKGAMLL
jgi:pantoate kinase